MISILSDFQDSEYLGVMKGVILSHSNNSRIVDLYNNVAPQNIREGAWILYTTYKYFPKKTVFLCVVDPGVGSKRRAVAIQTRNYFFVGPDNGLMIPTAENDGITKVVEMPVQSASATFHGRDVFAKAAAMLDRGISVDKLGEKTQIKTGLSFYLRGRVGEIVRLDVFDNIITNIPHIGKEKYDVIYNGKKRKISFYRTYEEAPENKLFLIEGSANTLEFSVKNRQASNFIRVKVGERIQIS